MQTALDDSKVVRFERPAVRQGLELLTRIIAQRALGHKLDDRVWSEMWNFYKSRGNVPGGMQVHRWYTQAVKQSS